MRAVAPLAVGKIENIAPLPFNSGTPFLSTLNGPRSRRKRLDIRIFRLLQLRAALGDGQLVYRKLFRFAVQHQAEAFLQQVLPHHVDLSFGRAGRNLGDDVVPLGVQASPER